MISPEGRMRMARETQETTKEESQEKKKGIRIDRNRQEQAARASLEFHYGRLPADHPAQQAAERALKRARRWTEGANLPQILVLPDWREINAAAIGENTVVLSSALLQFCDTEEGLIGIVGHELHHIESGDTAPEDPREEPGLETVIHHHFVKTGAERIAEHKADIQGAVVKLDAAGINPLGYKEFLTKLHNRFAGRYGHRYGATHGSALDRALSIGALARYYDLSNASPDLHWIEEREKMEWKKMPIDDKRWFTRSVRAAGTGPVHWTGADRKRRALFETMSLEKQLETFVLMNQNLRASVSSSIKNAGTAKKLDEDFYKTVTEKIRQHLRGYYEGNTEDKIEVAVRTNLEILGKSDESPLSKENLETIIKTLEDPEFLKALTLPITTNPAYLHTHWMKRAEVSDAFGSHEQETFSFDAWLEKATHLADAISNLAKSRGVLIVETETLIAITVRNLIAGLREKQKGSIEKAEIFFRNQGTEIEEEPKETKIQQEITEREDIKEVLEITKRSTKIKQPDQFKKTYEALRAICVGLPRRDIGKRLATAENLIEEAISEETTKLEEKMGQQRGYDERVAKIIAHSERTIRTASDKAYIDIIETESSFADLTTFQKRLWKISLLMDLHTFDTSKEWEWEIRRRNDAWLKDAQQESEASVRWLMRFLQNPEEEKGHQLGTETQKVITRAIVAWLLQHDTREILQHLNTWKESGLFAQKAMEKHPATATPLIAKIARELPRLEQTELIEEALVFVTNLTVDPFLKRKLEEARANDEWGETKNFSDKVRIAFESKRPVLEYVDKTIEEEMETQGEVQMVRDAMKKILGDIEDEHTETVGILAEVDLTRFEQRDPQRLLSLLLETKRSDKKLREVVAEYMLGGEDRLDYEIAKPEDIEEARAGILERLTNADIALASLLSLDRAERYYLAKRLLIDGGLIQEPEKRKTLFATLLEYRMAEGESEVRKWIEKVNEGMVDVLDWELLFHTISPVLVDVIARPPEKPTPWSEIYEVETFVEEMIDITELKPKNLRKLPKNADKEPWKSETRYTLLADDAVRTWLVTQGELLREEAEQLAPTEFIVNVAENIGSLAVRFLQLLPQFTEVGERHQAAFNRMLDGVKGQSKLAAVSVVEREWPEMWSEVKRFGKRLGGGSLMTVYEIEKHDGSRRVIRVRNPNVGYHLAISSAIVKETIDNMARNGAFDPLMHERLKNAVNYVEEWIKQDMDFSGFLERDARFKEMHEGFEAHGYEIHVPQAEGPESNYFQIEEEIVEGENLTQWDKLAEAGHDMKAISSLLAKNFVHQLATGLMHSDYHPGNFRVTPDKKVAILDRTFMLELNETERELVGGSLSGIVDPDKIKSYLVSFAKPGREKSATKAVEEHLPALATALQGGSAIDANRAFLEMRRGGVEIPLKLTLVLRNLHTLQTFAKKAGFSSLQEAVMA